MGKVSQWVIEEIRKKLREQRVLIWYDSDCAFKGFAENLTLGGARVVRFQGSYFRLRREVEDLFTRYGTENMAVLDCLLIYVPAPRLDERSDVLLGVAKAGGIFDATLETVARQALQSVYAPSELDALLANEKLTLEDLDRLGEPGAAGRGVIPMIFGTTTPHEIAVRYLVEPEMEKVLDAKGALPDLARLLAEAFGLPPDGPATHAEFKRRLGRHLLVNEFLAGLNAEVEVPALSRLALAARPQQVEACQRAASHLRALEPARDTYITLARQVQEEYRLRDLGLRATDLGGSDTFPFAAEVILAALPDLVAQGRVGDALRLLEGRASSFWVKHDQHLGVQWQAAGMAVRLVQEARWVEAEVRSQRWTPEAFVRLYAQSETGVGAWYLADTFYRLLEWRLAESEEDVALDDLVRAAREAHHQACERLAEDFLAAIKDHGFDFGRIEHQADVFQSEVAPALQTEPVAFFLVDALRYEMGVDLLERLPDAEDQSIRPAVAVPPTITRIGMAALLRGAEKGMAVIEAGGKAVAEVAGRVLATSPERMRFLDATLGGAVVDMPLDSLLSLGQKALAARLEGKRLLVVRSQEIDDIGERDSVHLARQVMTPLLFNLLKTVRKLAKAGVSRFVIAADHGYLLGEELSEAMKVDPPGGHTVELHRRCWIGRGGAVSEKYLRFKAVDLGVGGDLEFAFPRGLGAFKVAGGNQAYFHGGLSLQELVVPVLTFRLAAAPDPTKEDAFTLRTARDRITNRIFTVTVRYDQGTFLSTSERRVRCVGVAGGQEVAFAATAVEGYDPATQEVVLSAGQDNHITLMMQGAEGTGTLSIQLLDAATGAVLASRDVKFDLAM